ncbi:MAG: hypothetical protein UHS49_04460 [Faecalimonas sp.]|nr:hypothetical protein [Faecalimonas sp.]
MKNLKTMKTKAISAMLAFAMVASVLISGNTLVVDAAAKEYSPYYNATESKIYDCPEVGDTIDMGDVFKKENLTQEKFVIMFWADEYEYNEAIQNGDPYGSDESSVALSSSAWCEDQVVGDMNGVAGAFDSSKGWEVESVSYDATSKEILVHAISKDVPKLVDAVSVKLNKANLEKIKVGETLSDDVLESDMVSVSGVGVNTSRLGWPELLIKPIQAHVNAGYIDAGALEYDWLSVYDYADTYKVSETDVLGYGFSAIAATSYRFSLTPNEDKSNVVSLLDKGVVLECAKENRYYHVGDCLRVELKLGTVSDIAAILSGAANANDNNAQLANVEDAKKKVSLSEDEKAKINAGEKLELLLKFDNLGNKADTAEKKAIEAKLGDNKLATFLDIELIKKIGTVETSVSETSGLITIRFELPKEFQNTKIGIERVFKIIRNHNGKVEILDAKYDAKTNTITFETDKFSSYALVYRDAVAKSPNTGDVANAVLWTVLMLTAFTGVVAVFFRKKLYR